MDMVFSFDMETGEASFIHSDEAMILAEVVLGGEMSITRASHVDYDNDLRGWTADMGPSGGPVLGPFSTRTVALAKEVQWLHDNRGL